MESAENLPSFFCNPSVTQFFRKKIPMALGTSFCLFLASCASANLEMQDASFTGEQFTGNKMAVASIVDRENCGIRSQQAETILNSLASEIKKKRTRSSIVGPGEFKRIAGSGSSLDNVSSSRKSRALKKGVRYLLTVEINSNNISTNVSERIDETTETIYDEHGHAVGCVVVDTDYVTTSSTRRVLSAKYKIYDLELKKTVWVSNVQHSLSNSNSRENGFSYPPPPPFPPPPEVNRVFKGMSSAAIRKLPRRGF